MPQWRKLHTKIVESLDFQEMPSDFTRLVWVLLPLGVDREGRSLDNPALVKSRLMPLREDVSNDDIAQALDWFAHRGMIARYQHKGRGYFYIPTWHQYQGDTSREAPSTLPEPVELTTYSRPTLELVETSSCTEEKRVDAEEKRVDAEADAEPAAVAAIAQMWEDGTGKTVKQSDTERIIFALDNYGTEKVRHAFQEAYDHEAMKWPYINAILKADESPPKNKASPKRAAIPVATEDWTQLMDKERGNGHNTGTPEQQADRGKPDSIAPH